MNGVRVLETNILHASDVIHWLDGTTAPLEAQMLRIATPVQLELSTCPRDLRVVSGSGKSALLRRPTTPVIEGAASDSDRARPAPSPYPLAGIVSDAFGRIVPRAFSITAGGGTGQALVVYPSPHATRFGSAGGLMGTVRLHRPAGPVPLPWPILTLTVTPPAGEKLTFRAQADERGDFVMPLNRLPPLRQGLTHYTASLEIAGLAAATPVEPMDPADQQPMSLGDIATGAFALTIDFDIVPGEIRLIRTSGLKHLAVAP